jgi:NADH-quinone oxidoreductase subunit I
MTTATAKRRGWFGNLVSVTKSLFTGLKITMTYFLKPSTVITLQYPNQKDDLPDRHRGIHFLETEKCIMCWKCARACPVDCIDIEGTRDGEVDGAFQAKGVVITRFTIDYSRCIFCNLCCEPCPEQCIHMGQEFDFSAWDREGTVKSLLHNRVFDTDLKQKMLADRGEIKRLADEAAAAKKAKAEAAKKAKEAAAAGAAKPAPPPAAPGAQG